MLFRGDSPPPIPNPKNLIPLLHQGLVTLHFGSSLMLWSFSLFEKGSTKGLSLVPISKMHVGTAHTFNPHRKVNLRILTQKGRGYWLGCIGNIFGGAASLHIGLSARPPVCLLQLASGEVSLTILTSTIVGEYRRVFNNYPDPKN